MNDTISFGEFIKELRVKAGLSQQQLADLMFTSRSCISNWEIGKRRPDACMLGRLAHFLNIDRYQLFDVMQDDIAKSLNIIVVEDEPVLLKGFVHMLSKSIPAAEVYGFRTADDALLYVSSNVVSIAFLDIELGRSNGVDLAEKMMALYPRINIIFLTSHEEYMQKALDLHVSGYVLKPLTPEIIAREMAHLRYPIPLPLQNLVSSSQ
ncbi:MAG: response regulator [Clostridia bacterium]|nr:response regulator [Clostridia bacterium]